MLTTKYAIAKEVKSNPKQPSCKKSVRPPRRLYIYFEKYMKSKVAAKK